MAPDTRLIQELEKDSSLAQLIDAALSENSLLIDELDEGGAKAALLSLLARKGKRDVLVICGGADDRLLSDLSSLMVDAPLDFPSLDTLPGEEITPSPDLIGQRLEVLHELLSAKTPRLITASLQALLQPLPDPESLSPNIATWKTGDTLPFETVPETLKALGYTKTAVATDKGEFAVRGGIIDLFPLSSPDPYRVEFFGDTIEQIRTFDPISQKSTEKVTSLLLTPATEASSDSTLFDYLKKDALVIFNDLLSLEDHWVNLKKLFDATSLSNLLQLSSNYSRLFLAKEKLEELSDVKLTKKQGRDFYSGKQPLQPLVFEFASNKIDTKRIRHPFISIADALTLSENQAATTKEEILFTLSTPSRSHITLHLLYSSVAEKEQFLSTLNHELPKNSHHHLTYLSSGFFLEENQLALLPMTEFSRVLKPRRQKWRNTHHTPASDFHELSPGDSVVHYHHGIAKYKGVEKKEGLEGAVNEYLILEYSGKSTLFVPVSQSHLVSRYIGTQEEVPTLSQLGSNKWQKTRALAQTAITGYASSLVSLYAERELKGGFACPEDSREMQLFEEEFPYVPTQDQLLATGDIKGEMQSSQAMDRLVCGDVGYGKTEVAMRSAFKAAIDGKKQVAVLVPTTVLAMQHAETFKERMKNFPVKVGVLSRFCTAKENRETLKAVREGTINIVVGTHRLLSKDVAFYDLGLLIIDEEQRFGVRAKEHLKRMKKGVDCLSLSATPIPRTLYLSLVGARAISTINTPPQDRLPIKSIIAQKDSALIKAALLRELTRDGQAYFIHNRIESIFRVSEELQALVPEAKIVVAHGQMSADELDTIFHSFKQGTADILVATTIVENGIDIPNANTILIDRADTFGLADLYQMRGRVGRWNRPAFAYFLTPPGRELPELTRKRLHAIAESSGFGGGMKVAMRDLEIRGAGDILGTSQSGQVSSIGFHLYCKLLKRAVDALKKGKSPSFTETKMEFSFDATLPESYINEPSLRMEIYHRLGEATEASEIDAILEELKDRFGKPPRPVLWLYHMTHLRLFASARYFTHLKFARVTLTAEKQVGKTTIKKQILLKTFKDPKELRLFIEESLLAQFS